MRCILSLHVRLYENQKCVHAKSNPDTFENYGTSDNGNGTQRSSLYDMHHK